MNTPVEYARLPEASRLFGLSRSKLYVLAGAGRIRFIKVGGTTFADLKSIRAYFDNCPDADIAPHGSPTTAAV